MQSIIKVFEDNHIEPPWSYVAVFALDVLLLLALAFCLRELRRARRAAVEADAVVKPDAPLFEGARFVAGVVEFARGEEQAVRVTITQEGTEQVDKNNNKSHTWEERGREVEARPFYLCQPGGERVRIEPPDDVMLVDTLDQKEWLAPAQRKRRAELLPGEWAVVEGRLYKAPDPEADGQAAGYRQAAATGWVMRPSPQKGMHVSTEGLSRRHELRARAFQWTCLWVVLLGLFMNAPLFTYRARLFLGENVVATYQGKRVYTSTSKGKQKNHYTVHVTYERAPEEGGLIDVDDDDYDELPNQRGEIWVRRVPLFEAATALGQGSSVWSVLWVAAALIVGLAWLRVQSTHGYRRWYEGRVVDKGRGPLPVQTNERFLADDPVALAARKRRGLPRSARRPYHVEGIDLD
ncbi:hypothetical protein [Polyangium spumosum]|uniref:Uncharacterized protein n=1 Tax=Polyangium spumosum TaxID=889282 RepID=A0A6N7PRD2_9BACT|nr:hypothetical protein [Polyangium spumosum]MRG91411.1 hypothetical protein [Polyangium spumosum]